ncbi:Hypothetical protein SAMN05720766_10974 [Fibrobacter sp. UWH9]|uniref:DUF2513 domain-containing protein n=1 Tax=Fibrobacter sp. UWH9 TaxID=1896213 RepID=UPI0009170C3D|nr:DUF2513 domain-containing protein [Fibrobacter sp. UWH9]SHH25711.1 Hypothetical protein SAMN05720766_10974 [Fibrobacter sp. UWH9]
MERDMDLVREILLDIESVPAGCDWEHKDYGRNEDTVYEHIQIMKQAGLVSGGIHEGSGGRFPVSVKITWNGYEFLDASRDSKVWNSVKQKAMDSGVSLTFDVLLNALKMAAQTLDKLF